MARKLSFCRAEISLAVSLVTKVAGIGLIFQFDQIAAGVALFCGTEVITLIRLYAGMSKLDVSDIVSDAPSKPEDNYPW
ncbi:hypothetical protein ACYPKM_04625 [Pseudomonas aeruginosa]